MEASFLSFQLGIMMLSSCLDTSSSMLPSFFLAGIPVAPSSLLRPGAARPMSERAAASSSSAAGGGSVDDIIWVR